MVRPSLEFFELIFAVFKIGALPVVVDPGMGIRRMLECYRSTRPLAMIGVPMAHAVRALFLSISRRARWGHGRSGAGFGEG